MNTLQWFMNLPAAQRQEIITSIKRGQEAVKEVCDKTKLQELLDRLEEDHRFAKMGEASEK